MKHYWGGRGEMNCADLERCLEACLDGTLGRGRLALFKRHLHGCPGCRARVERLRGFERDLHRRFRCMEGAESLWAPIELSLVEPGLVVDERPHPPALPRGAVATKSLIPAGRALPAPVGAEAGRRRTGWWRFAGVATIAVMAATLFDLGFGGGNASGLAAYRGVIDGDEPLEIRTGDMGSLDGWFRARLGTDPPALPEPAEARLIGAGIENGAADGAALVLYDIKGTPAVLRVDAAAAGGVPEAGQTEALGDGLTEVSWADGRFRYTIVSPLPADKLGTFAE